MIKIVTFFYCMYKQWVTKSVTKTVYWSVFIEWHSMILPCLRIFPENSNRLLIQYWSSFSFIYYNGEKKNDMFVYNHLFFCLYSTKIYLFICLFTYLLNNWSIPPSFQLYFILPEGNWALSLSPILNIIGINMTIIILTILNL